MENLYSKVRVTPFSKEGSKIKAMASVLVADAVWLHKLRVIDGSHGLFVDVPSLKIEKTGQETKYDDIYHPSSKEARDLLTQIVLDEYKKKVAA